MASAPSFRAQRGIPQAAWQMVRFVDEAAPPHIEDQQSVRDWATIRGRPVRVRFCKEPVIPPGTCDCNQFFELHPEDVRALLPNATLQRFIFCRRLLEMD